MRKIATMFAAGGLLLLSAASASAVCNGGGNDETSESIIGPVWVVATTPTPGTVPAGLTGNDVIISEIAYSGNNQEFIEIYNPTPFSIDLSQYYLSDDFGTGGYYNIVTGALYTGVPTTDWNIKFPAGTLAMAPGEVIVIWCGAAAGAPWVYSVPAGVRLYQIAAPATNGATLMVPFGNTPSNANGLVTNGGEFVMLYKWDGACDLVCDTDYIAWGTVGVSSRVDKTGRSADGPDADANPSAYLNDTPGATQGAGLTHVAGQSLARAGVGTHAANGNGCNNAPTPTQSNTWGQLKTRYR